MSGEDVTNHRKSSYKKVDNDAIRNNRLEFGINLRKGKKMESIARRREMTVSNDETMTQVSSVSSDIHSLLSTLRDESSEEAAVLIAMKGFRCLLCIGADAPVAEVLEIGALPVFIFFLESTNHHIVFEATWILTNIASTDHASAVALAVPFLVPLLMSASEDVREQAAWCLANIAGDCTHLRDVVLHADAVTYIVKNIENPNNLSLLENMVWTLSNLCRGKPQPKLSLVLEALPCIIAFIKRRPLDCVHILVDACWFLSYFCDGENERIQKVVESGILPILVDFLSEPTLVVPALKTLANIVTGSDEQTQAVLDCNVLEKLPKLFQSSKDIRKDVCWMLSNIAGGSQSQINAICKKAAVLSNLVAAIRSSEWEIRKEAIWAASNITAGGNDGHVVALVHFGAIECLCDNLRVNDTDMLMIILNTLDNILKVGKRHGKPYDFQLDEAGGLDMIEGLQQHSSEAIFKRALSIIETHFDADEADIVDENIAPLAGKKAFAFGVPQKLFHGENQEA